MQPRTTRLTRPRARPGHTVVPADGRPEGPALAPGSPPGPPWAYGAIRRRGLLGDGTARGVAGVRGQKMELTGVTADHDAVTSFLAKAAPAFEGR